MLPGGVTGNRLSLTAPSRRNPYLVRPCSLFTRPTTLPDHQRSGRNRPTAALSMAMQQQTLPRPSKLEQEGGPEEATGWLVGRRIICHLIVRAALTSKTAVNQWHRYGTETLLGLPGPDDGGGVSDAGGGNSDLFLFSFTGHPTSPHVLVREPPRSAPIRPDPPRSAPRWVPRPRPRHGLWIDIEISVVRWQNK
ncbi:hypothetical protein GGTG_07705 [Gaeumannomyces tritici R3-111a-1]|uniref:Uncharacterized protein n=1 Tax=Gaeumannomyces tritici (strain R3-111a-1) TaxID=644352 RepID=J3P2F8_GAET3|nr:hypothetical protein GGTG_07705 [Gaeumannomyces tritici R3-111a-1]EJT73850.1 hypothetical protein GGTG_07705 [Gaeumannomyces tritici R3-111a-1]